MDKLQAIGDRVVRSLSSNDIFKRMSFDEQGEFAVTIARLFNTVSMAPSKEEVNAVFRRLLKDGNDGMIL